MNENPYQSPVEPPKDDYVKKLDRIIDYFYWEGFHSGFIVGNIFSWTLLTIGYFTGYFIDWAFK